MGNLDLQLVIARNNVALGTNVQNPIYGGAIAAWNGNASLNQTWLTENEADQGGGIFYGGTATGTVQRSTLSANRGGGLDSRSTSDLSVANSTFSANAGGRGVITNLRRFAIANYQSHSSSISADGRYVTFISNASNLVPGDTNNTEDVLVYDRTTGTIQRVNVSDTGVQANALSFSPSISADGRFVTFASTASNLVPGDTNNHKDIFVYDRTTATIERVSVSDTGMQANRESSAPSISADGRYVAFSSWASNLVSDHTNDSSDIFVYDRATRTIERVNLSGAGWSTSPSISADGRYVAFVSSANIFVYDRTTRTVEQVSDAGVQGNGPSPSPSISADGRFVAFVSRVGGFTGGSNIFVYDRNTKTSDLIDVTLDSGQWDHSISAVSISADGRYVTFESVASTLWPGGTNNAPNIFIHDRTTRTTQRVSVSNAGVQTNGASLSPSISADGRFVTFESTASNLVPGDINNSSDIFLYDRTTGLIEPVTFSAIESTIFASHITVAHTSGQVGGSAIVGDVRMENSLLVASVCPEI